MWWSRSTYGDRLHPASDTEATLRTSAPAVARGSVLIADSAFCGGAGILICFISTSCGSAVNCCAGADLHQQPDGD